jgi:hypothetical protein
MTELVERVAVAEQLVNLFEAVYDREAGGAKTVVTPCGILGRHSLGRADAGVCGRIRDY